MMIVRIKLLFAKLTILIALLSLGATTYHYSQVYSLSKSFQLGVLVALAILASAATLLFIFSLLLTPVITKLQNNHEVPSPKEESHAIPKEERIIRHSTKEEYVEYNSNERESIYEAQRKLTEMKQEQGANIEVLLVLPFDLSFLLAKDSIENLFWGRIQEENKETGIILGSAGFGSTPQEIKISLQAMTDHSTSVNIISKSSSKHQSESKNLSYIKKISDFLRKKEKFYIE